MEKHTKRPTLLPLEQVAQRILMIRGQRVLLDADLARLYGVELRVLNQAVKRNIDRFPDDFMIRLTNNEYKSLRSQIVIIKNRSARGRHSKYSALVFTEQGVAMLSTVLRSKRAIAVNIQIMRAFVKLREMLSTHKELARKLRELEDRYDHQFAVVFDAIRKLMEPPAVPKKRQIGFVITDNDP
jgi:hypothetical protein